MRTTVSLSYEKYDERFTGVFDGVGLIRSEYIFRAVGRYPGEASVDEFAVPYLLETAARVGPRRLWYRTLEVDTAEANVLEGVEEVVVEEDRLLGMRGVRRSMAHAEAFHAELRGLAVVRARGVDVGVIIPFVTYVEELRWAVDQARVVSPDLPVATMLETPAALVELDRLVACGLTRVLVGCNDLSSLLLARPRGVRGPVTPSSPLLRAITRAREVTWAAGVELAVAGYLHRDLIEACRALGVDECVVHYSDLPQVFGDEWADLPDLDVLPRTKARTRAAIAEFNERMSVDQRVY